MQLTNEEMAIQAKDNPEIMADLWEAVQRLIWKWAMRYLPANGSSSRYDMDDLMQAGYLALVSAVEKYPEDCEHKFNTYLGFHCRTQFRTVLGIRTSKREPDAVSLDAPIAGGDLMIQDTLEDTGAGNAFREVEDQLYNEALSEALEKALNTIPDRQADVLRERFYEQKTLREVGEQLGVGTKRARDIQESGLRGMRKGKAYRLLKDYDYRAAGLRGTGLTSFRQTGMSSTEAAVLWMMGDRPGQCSGL